MGSAAVKRIAVHVLRLLLCAAAFWWVLHGLSWRDWITLPDGRRVQLVGVADGRVEVLDPALGRVVLEPRDVLPGGAGELRIDYGIPSVWRQSSGWLLGMSLLVFAPVPLMSSVRFVWMLRAQNIRIRYWESVKLTYAGNFFNFVMFGTTGGDLFKAYYVAQHTPHKVEAVTAVLLDRIVGLIGIVLLAAAAMCLRLDDARIRQLLLWVLAMLGAMLAGLVLFYLPALRGRLRPTERLRWVPGIDKLARIDRAALRMREHPAIVLGAFVVTAALQAVAVASFCLWGEAVGMKADWPSYYAYIGVSLVVAAVPVTPMGLGTMEAALVLFLRGAYGTHGQVVLLALGIRLVQLAWALPGILVPLTGAHRPSPDRVRQMQAEMAAEEAASITKAGS